MKKLVKKIVWKLTGGYQPKEFWDNWADDFIKDSWQTKIHPQHKWLLKKINAMKPESILEVGCGFGRNIKFLIENGVEPSSITGVDISENMIKLAKDYIKNHKVKLFVFDLFNLDMNKKFDFVFTHGVLMHIPEDQIDRATDKLVSLSKKSLVLIEQNYKANNNYTFVHDYKKLLSSKKIDIIEYRRNKKIGLDLIYAKVR